MTKKHAPATNRNRQPILEVLKEIIPQTGNILEIASGTGEHSLFFAPHFPQQEWIPSDKQREYLESIQAWRRDCPTDNLQQPMMIDVMKKGWYETLLSRQIKVVICINMIHIAPWLAYLGLIEGAKEILPVKGIVYLYGPYKVQNQHTAPSNEEFDRSLQIQNSTWGVRNLEDVVSVAKENNFVLEKKVSMPANNLSLVFRKK